ncbi:MerR family transcriptional regulator [Chungangia koreensis]|uniref:MerR family transcriptional regulator n=1 Tax=Chungangia koreensis TaxID=752657 RepID=A0ABV8WZK7_9LACT
MEYTVKKLGKLAGISPRTLRYYDEIGLLQPARINSSGYRIYGQGEVDRLQQILFYRELGVELEQIKEILSSPDFDATSALLEHKEKLVEKRMQLDALITNVEKTINQKERGIVMSDQEKFEGFKKKMIEENEKKFGKEAREKYGDDAINRSNSKLMGVTQEQYEAVTKLHEEFAKTLKAAYATGDAASELAQKAAELHKQWLAFYWDSYTPEAHAGVAQMYVDDERFTAFYDNIQPGSAPFLRDAIFIYTGMKK